MDFSIEESLDVLIALIVSSLFLSSVSFHLFSKMFYFMFERIL